MIIKAVLLMLICMTPPAYSIDDTTALRVILGEAESEPQIGRIAVGEVLRARNSTRGFYGLRAVQCNSAKCYRITKNRKREIPTATIAECLQAWRASAYTRHANGATHFENIGAFGIPKWAYNMQRTARIGQHTFYKNNNR